MLKILTPMLAVSLLAAAASSIAPAVADDAPPPAAAPPKLATGITPLAQLLELMDTDKNGKVSKEEFMRFMEAEFDYADKNKDGELDPAEMKKLVYRMNHPSTGIPRVRK